MENFWEIKGWEEDDKHLSTIAKSPFRRPFPFSLPTKNGLYVIRGPRQVGKSSWIKTLLSEACRKKHACFYLSCENIRDQQELNEILKSVKSTRYIFLDEINFVKGWDRAIKHAIDSGLTQILFLTGSHAADIRRGVDQMPGRWEAGDEYHLLPMDFHEFSQMRKMANWPIGHRVEELLLYFRIGGFPMALAEAGRNGKDPVKARETYKRWLSGDITRLGKQEIYLREVLGQLAKTLTSTLSLQTLAQKTQMGSHHTAQEYVSILEDCFALKTLYALDPDDDSLRFRKEKKFYFRDPLIFWIALEWSGQKIPENADEMIAEMVAHETLFRRFPKKRFGYYSSKKGEIDFIGGHDWALEVKWAPYPQNLSSAFKNFRAKENIVWTYNNFLLEWPSQK